MRASEKVVERMIHEDHSARFIVEAERHAARINGAYPNVPEDVRRAVLSADPTGGSYADWIINKVQDGTLQMPEDAEKTRELLTQFHRLKQSPKFNGNRNLYAYKTYGDLAKAIHGQATQTRHSINRDIGGQPVVARSGNLELIQLGDAGAAEEVCRHTHWCIRKPSTFAHYQKHGSLFVVLKNGQPYVAVEPKSQAMDVYDDPIDAATAQEIAPLFRGIQFPASALEQDAEEQSRKKQADVNDSVRRRYVNELMAGRVDRTGRRYAPVSREYAEAAFEKQKDAFARAVGGVGHIYGFVNSGLVNLARAVNALRR